jgi:glycosyltransferase involved in cell wall biosynthesis
MMRILFDHQVFSEHVYGGVSRYFCSLAHALWEQDSAQVRIVAPLYVNQYLGKLPPSLRWGLSVNARPGTRRAICKISGGLSRVLAPAFGPDLIHETYYSAVPTGGVRKPRVVTVFDMIHERCMNIFGERDQVRAAKIAAINRAAHILCISEHTRRDLIELLRIPEEKISVTHLAADVFPEPEATSQEILCSTNPYLLYVGGRFGYKNFESLLRAWGNSKWLRQNFRLVCFGGGGFSRQEYEWLRELNLREGEIAQLSGSDATLAALYRGAAALVYPSLYEGFGIPPLEAMSQDCPVICSRSTSIPEVVGDAGEYFDPSHVESLESALLAVLQSEDKRKKLMEAGRRRYPLFSWERCAQQTATAYKKVIA